MSDLDLSLLIFMVIGMVAALQIIFTVILILVAKKWKAGYYSGFITLLVFLFIFGYEGAITMIAPIIISYIIVLPVVLIFKRRYQKKEADSNKAVE